jgi:SAM-dependent methyltransferase
VICSNDLTAADRASAMHRKHGVTANVTYQNIDATSIPYENRFDIIVFKSVLGGIHAEGFASQQLAMAQIHKALKPGGRLLFAENLVGTPLHAAARALAYRRRGITWRFLTLAEIELLLQPFAAHEWHTTGVSAMFGLYEAQRDLLARFDTWVLNMVTPPRWRYVVYGTATR